MVNSQHLKGNYIGLQDTGSTGTGRPSLLGKLTTEL